MSEQANEKIKDSFENMRNALTRLEEALVESRGAPSGSLLIDGTIQRFEICADQIWKLFMRILRDEKIEIEPSPKKILQKAYAMGWINDEKLWLGIQDDRNQTSHIYDEQLAKEIYERIKTYYPIMQAAFDSLFSKYLSS